MASRRRIEDLKNAAKIIEYRKLQKLRAESVKSLQNVLDVLPASNSTIQGDGDEDDVASGPVPRVFNIGVQIDRLADTATDVVGSVQAVAEDGLFNRSYMIRITAWHEQGSGVSASQASKANEFLATLACAAVTDVFRPDNNMRQMSDVQCLVATERLDDDSPLYTESSFVLKFKPLRLQRKAPVIEGGTQKETFQESVVNIFEDRPVVSPGSDDYNLAVENLMRKILENMMPYLAELNYRFCGRQAMNVADSYRNVARNKVCICNDGTWKPLEGKDDETVKDIVALNKDGIQSDNDNDGDALKQRAPNRSLRNLMNRNRANRKKKDAEKAAAAAAAAAAAELASKEDVGNAGDDIEEADLFGDDEDE